VRWLGRVDHLGQVSAVIESLCMHLPRHGDSIVVCGCGRASTQPTACRASLGRGVEGGGGGNALALGGGGGGGRGHDAIGVPS
jgi:hypothetical protein